MIFNNWDEVLAAAPTSAAVKSPAETVAVKEAMAAMMQPPGLEAASAAPQQSKVKSPAEVMKIDVKSPAEALKAAQCAFKPHRPPPGFEPLWKMNQVGLNKIQDADAGSDTQSTDADGSDVQSSMDMTCTESCKAEEVEFLKVDLPSLSNEPPSAFKLQPHETGLQAPGQQLKACVQEASELQQMLDEVAMLEQQLASLANLSTNLEEKAASKDQKASSSKKQGPRKQAPAERTPLRSLNTKAKIFVPMQSQWTPPQAFATPGYASGYNA